MTIAQQLGAINREQTVSQAAREFCHVARYLAMAKGDWPRAHALAKKAGELPRIVEALQTPPIAKSSVSGGAFDTWAAEFQTYQQLSDAFALSLRQASAFQAMLPDMRSVPLGLGQIAIASGGATGSTVNPGQVKPVSKITFATNANIDPKKTLAQCAVTNELLRVTNSQVFMQELERACAEAIDSAFVSDITLGIAATASNGGTAIAILQDLAAALSALSLDIGSKVYLLVDSATAKTWSVKTTSTGELLFPQMTPTGGTVQGMPVLVTAGISQQIVAVAADGIAAALGALELEASDQVTYQLDTAPDSPPTASTVMVSAWQNNQTMIKVTRYWTVERLRSTAVAVISGLNYGSANSPA